MAVEVRYGTLADGREVAYRVMSDGDGPVLLHLTAGPWPLDLLDEDPMYDRFLRTLGSYGRVVVFDRLGLGSSDRFDPDRDWLDQMADVCVAVLDSLEVEAAWIVGMALPEIATLVRAHPTRVLGAVLINPMSRRQFEEVVDSSVRRDRRAETEPRVTPSRAGDAGLRDWLARANRLGATASDRAVWMEAQRASIDRFLENPQPILDGPPTVLIRRRDAMSVDEVERWSGIFGNTECITIEGSDGGVLGLDAGLIAELAAGFITGRQIEAAVERRLVAVLFTDLVDSTISAARSGDAVWRSTLDRYEANLHTTVQRLHGTVVKHTGDGALATFPSGSEAVAAAVELRNTTRDLGLDGRTGIHVGEVEQRGDDISGIAVNLAARVMGEADPGEILASSTVTQTALGSRFRFEDLGPRTLKGIEEPWQLFTIEPER